MEISRTSDAIELDHEADIGVARRRIGALAASAGLDEARAGDAALIATELATNVLRHARHGGVILGCVGDGEVRGVSVIAWDRGPGMNVDACVRDGMSTAGTPGKGLGAVTRIATRWDAYTLPGKGCVIDSLIFPKYHVRKTQFDVGGVCLPYPGLQVCGDAWEIDLRAERATLLVCDGLGHGDGAAEASQAITRAFRDRPDGTPAQLLERLHGVARSTRGAAATIVQIDRNTREATIAAVGNVSAWIVGDQQRQLVTQHGTLGQATPRIREERYPFPAGALLVVTSDGLKSRIDLADHAGLRSCDPLTIAGVLWRDHARGRDDATAVVLREVSA
ncbi:MAG TPA: SpoIIE family protein phosphatase [Kofleriaceae bacterium]|nr:SpoIIE family protein phosphatase [Kofleriaceae bacterium]